jgi:hypothetical protein
MTCQESQTRGDLVDTLFNTREESEASIERLNTSSTFHQLKNKTHEAATHSHKASKSMQTLDSRTSERSQSSYNGQQNSRNTGIKVHTDI